MNEIRQKLADFTRVYYLKRLVQGALLALILLSITFLLLSGIEWVLWLDSTWRLVLFSIWILAIVGIIWWYVVVPIAYLFRIKRGISEEEASVLIGKHFSDIKDKLANIVELSGSEERSDLVLAAIEKRSKAMEGFVFVRAVNWRSVYRMMRLLVIPLALFLILNITGYLGDVFNSYERLRDYDLAFEKPAPFEFILLSPSLNPTEDSAFNLIVGTKGELRPEEVYVVTGGERLMMRNVSGTYQMEWNPPLENFNFYLEANEVRSNTFSLEVLQIPSISDFEMQLAYPSYLNKKLEVIKGTGNASVPEGTRISWGIRAEHVENIAFKLGKETAEFDLNQEYFVYKDIFKSSGDYEIRLSNSNVKNSEVLEYHVEVIKDEYPSIEVDEVLNEGTINLREYRGEMTDDHGLTQVRLVYYLTEAPLNREVFELTKLSGTTGSFSYSFPSGIDLVPGSAYSFYFEVVDNDGLRGGKVSRSGIFQNMQFTEQGIERKQREAQNKLLEDIENEQLNMESDEEIFENFNDRFKSESNLDYDQRQKLQELVNRRKLGEQQMQKFIKQLGDNLHKQDDERSRLLRERLERQQIESKKNEELLKELERLAEKFDGMELQKKLEELDKKSATSNRNLEQLVELTKRYYVEEKVKELSDRLLELSKKQLDLSKRNNEVAKEQESIKNAFEKWKEELDQLKQDNNGLNKPMKFEVPEDEIKAIEEDQQGIEEDLKELGKKGVGSEEGQEKVKKRQESTGKKMMELAKQMRKQGSMGSSQSAMVEDADMLRQILDNLVAFSINQEQLMEEIGLDMTGIVGFGNLVKRQKALKELFEHVDDSLFTLSLRRVELSEFVNEQIEEVFYNIEGSLEDMAENKEYQAVSHQQYVVTAANSLADFLAKVLSNIQSQMTGSSGSGNEDFQLPDIISGQQQLKEKMGSASGKGQQQGGKSESGKSGKEGDRGKQKGSESGSKGEGQAEGKGKEKGQGKGASSDGQNTGSGLGGDNDIQELYEIYKEQQMLRKQLEFQLNNMINEKDREMGKRIARQMEQFEEELLNTGVTQRTMDKMNRIQYQLMKLENAVMKQGRKKERQSETSNGTYDGVSGGSYEKKKESRVQIEVLNREVLPLLFYYKNKVRVYFEGDGGNRN
ncbi:MAG: hypothetical protein AAGF77_06045 [Bacteroidota bacterium]